MKDYEVRLLASDGSSRTVYVDAASAEEAEAAALDGEPAGTIPYAARRERDETVGQRLRRLRLEQGLSQRELAAPGVSYAYISRIEAGTRTPSVKALRKLAARLGVSAGYLETGSDDLVHVLVLGHRDTTDELLVAFDSQAEALSWAEIANRCDPSADGYYVASLKQDDMDTLRGVAKRFTSPLRWQLVAPG